MYYICNIKYVDTFNHNFSDVYNTFIMENLQVHNQGLIDYYRYYS